MEREVQLRGEEKEFQMQKMRMMVMGPGVHQLPQPAGGSQRRANHGSCHHPHHLHMDNNYPCNKD